jgi:ABC-2 type transport system permease protein
MISISQALLAEWLRLKRTFTPYFVLALPVSLVSIALILRYLTPNANVWNYYVWSLLNWWPLIWLPFGIALLAAHTMTLEKRAGTWKALRARAIEPSQLYLAKLLVLTAHTLVSSLLLIVLSLLCGILLLKGTIPWLVISSTAVFTWIAAFPLVALMLWAAFIGGYGLTLGLTLIGFFAGAIVALKDIWFLLPWALPLRMATPLAGLNPNGVPLQPGDPAWHIPVLPIVAVALAGYVLFALLGTLWFTHKEVK